MMRKKSIQLAAKKIGKAKVATTDEIWKKGFKLPGDQTQQPLNRALEAPNYGTIVKLPQDSGRARYKGKVYFEGSTTPTTLRDEFPLSKEQFKSLSDDAKIKAYLELKREYYRQLHSLPNSQFVAPELGIEAKGSFESENSGVCSLLDQGGFGTVYRAVDSIDKKEVALKIIMLRSDIDAKAAKNECRIHARLPNHDQIVCHYSLRFVSVLKNGGRETSALITMELCKEGSLKRYLDPNTVASSVAGLSARLRQSFLILGDCMDGLAAMHALRYVHRDLKPANILLVKDGATGFLRAKLGDFGLSAEVGTKPVSGGTPFFSAPEQFQGDTVCETSADVYSLGAVFFALMSDIPESSVLERRIEKGVSELVTACDWPTNTAWKDRVFKQIKDMTQAKPTPRPTLQLVKKRLKGFTDGLRNPHFR